MWRTPQSAHAQNAYSQFTRGVVNTDPLPPTFAGQSALARPAQRPPPVVNRPVRNPSRCACN
jgi:hypothetical protein